MTPQLPKDGRTYRIWSVVEELILDRYGELAEERMRDSYYLLREWLEPLRADETIQDAEFDYFVDNYEYYRDDFWPRIEERHGIRRPETKPPTVVIERGDEYTESRIPDAWERARGFLFVEKSGMAEDLEPLSNHGWLIVAAQGESTRTFREAVADDGTDRPVLVVTDADFYGGGITESLKGHSDRTEHLGLWRELEERVQGIGLSQADADALDLPRERDPTQSPDKWRTELNALAVLKERQGIETPLLSYVTAKMDVLGIPLAPDAFDDPRDQVAGSLRRAIEEALSDQISDVVDGVLEDVDPVGDLDATGEGGLVSLRMYDGGNGDVDMEPLQESLESVAETRLDRLGWWRRSRYEDHVRSAVGEDQVAQIREQLPSGGGEA